MSLPGLKPKKRWLLRLSLASLVLAGLAVTSMSSPVSAANSPANCNGTVHLGRVNCRGFFTNKLVDIPTEGSYVIPAGVYTYNAPDYLALMKKYLNTGDRQEQISSAYTIAVMLGQPPTSFGNSADNGITWARANFDRWAKVVNYYEAQGLIDWDVNWSTNSPYEDSGYGTKIQDDYYVTYEPTSAELIIFRMPPGYTGKPFRIDHSCANIQGSDQPLPYPPGDSSGDINPPTPGDANNPPGYNSGDTNLYSSCTVVSGHAFDPSNTSYQVPVSLTYRVGASVIGTDNTIRASTTGSHQWTANTPAAVRGSPNAVTVSGTYRAADGTVLNLTNSPITIGPCLKAAPACFGATWAPASIDPGTPYTVTANVRYGSAPEADVVMARADTRLYIKINGPGVNTTLTYAPAQITRTGTVLSVTTAQQPPTGQTGSYLIGYGISGSFGAIDCGASNASDTSPPKFSVVSKPYFTVQGGDISAGAGMSVGGNECAAGGVGQNTKAGVVSWNRGSGFGYNGAGTQYGALALGHLQEFATGKGSSLAPSGVSFGNSGGDATQVDPTQGLYGGEFGGQDCTGDYFKDVDPSAIQSSQTIGAQAIPNCTGSNDAQCRKVIYVSGDVYINGNITFSGVYPDASTIPSFAVVVKGNIYIAPGVTRLDGFYIAQPTNGISTDGVIYTCAPSPSIAAALDNDLATTCNKSLTVNGAFIGRQIWLLRTAGTVSTTPAEIFNYTPEVWLSAPYDDIFDPSKAEGYDAITSLPPVL